MQVAVHLAVSSVSQLAQVTQRIAQRVVLTPASWQCSKHVSRHNRRSEYSLSVHLRLAVLSGASAAEATGNILPTVAQNSPAAAEGFYDLRNGFYPARSPAGSAAPFHHKSR